MASANKSFRNVGGRQNLGSGFKNCHNQAKIGWWFQKLSEAGNTWVVVSKTVIARQNLYSGFKNCQRQAKLAALFTEWNCDRQREDFLFLQSIQLLTVYGCSNLLCNYIPAPKPEI